MEAIKLEGFGIDLNKYQHLDEEVQALIKRIVSLSYKTVFATDDMDTIVEVSQVLGALSTTLEYIPIKNVLASLQHIYRGAVKVAIPVLLQEELRSSAYTYTISVVQDTPDKTEVVIVSSSKRVNLTVTLDTITSGLQVKLENIAEAIKLLE